MAARSLRLRAAAPALLGVLAGACGTLEPGEPALPPLAVRIEPPAVYSEWFARTATCSGLTGSPQTIEWYVVPGASTFRAEGADRVGMWQRSDGRSQIVIAGAYEHHEMVVRHEMLHHLIGEAGHPTDLFEERCPLTWERWNQRGLEGASGD